MIVYAACPGCDFIEMVSGYVRQILHEHGENTYALIRVRTKKEAKAHAGKWLKPGRRAKK